MLEISINKDFFGEKYKDLIPHAIEHELYEIWLGVKKGVKPKTLKTMHTMARQRQFDLAMADGKAEKLLFFYLYKNLGSAGELLNAYNKAKKRIRNRDLVG